MIAGIVVDVVANGLVNYMGELNGIILFPSFARRQTTQHLIRFRIVRDLFRVTIEDELAVQALA